MRFCRCLAAAALGLVPLLGCQGGSGNGSPTAPTPGNPSNPCATALVADLAASAQPDESRRQEKRAAVDRHSRYRVFDALSLHREAVQWRQRRERELGPVATAPGRGAGPDSVDIGEIAVIQDQGDIIAPPNAYDLRGLGLRFTKNGSGGYDVRRITAGFRTTLGTQLTLSDDDSTSRSVPFGFNFYARTQTAAFVNSDGNVTFEEEDRASTERNVGRLLTGPPRVAVFLADLDPTAGGRIFLNARPDEYTVTWCAVRGFESARSITAQLTLLPDGSVEMQYQDATALPDAVVGLSPGRTGEFRSVDLSNQGPTSGGSGAVGERFAERPQLDTVALTKQFYATHPDNYDQLVIWADATLVQTGFAYEQTVANEVGGIGVAQFDASREFGSGGRLRSVVMMDWVGKYPDDPQAPFLGENNTVSILGQETGHRWLAFMDFRDARGARSDLLLGRDQAHWSFFFDSDASVMEGNDIEDLGGGRFRTAAAVRRYSLLDQYAMGLVRDVDVPSFFYVDNPTNMSANRNRESAPQVGVTFNGTRREVLIQDIIAIHGPRTPPANQASRVHRQAFIYLSSAGRSPESGQVAKLDRIRRQWEQFFLQATDGRMQAITTLR